MYRRRLRRATPALRGMPLDSIDDARTITKHTIVPSDRKAAISLAAGMGLTAGLDCRLAAREGRANLAGTEEWPVF